LNLVDSSCWLEYFAGSEVGDAVASAVENLQDLIVPSITIFEVFKKILLEVDEDRALLAAAHMKQGRVVDLDADLSIYAAKVGREFQLALADSIIYATALKYGCVVWSQDKHFQELPHVKYFPKRK
jgi:predicted nucleic acid-binding protein